MQIKDYLARILMWSALVTATTTLPAMGQTNYPLRLRGSSGITTAYTDGNLVIEFQPGTSPAGNGLQPGQGSWLDRGLRPTEPNVLKQTVSLDQAKAIADYLRTEAHFATFYCYNTNQGYFQAGNSAPFIPESVSSNNPTSSGFNPDGGSNSPDGGSSGNGAVVLSGNTIARGTAINRRDGKDCRDDHKDHRDDGKERHEVANKSHDEGKEHHEKDHHTGTGSHGVALVKAHPKSLVKANPKPAPRATTKAAPHPASKKKA
jgi:hypothetical protein